ncbi:unnamed protein product [Periconia digitata]|uniref:Uncharacterized protein n=1 Tax=Periconia digitata TaxID=1303443 RepID=A0A9W4XWW1_9PLEO|nr:unnamed protein product [Periconia digitata]
MSKADTRTGIWALGLRHALGGLRVFNFENFPRHTQSKNRLKGTQSPAGRRR